MRGIQPKHTGYKTTTANTYNNIGGNKNGRQDKLIDGDKKKYSLTNKGIIVLDIAKNYFEAKGNFEDKERLLKENYNIIMDNLTDNCPKGAFNRNSDIRRIKLTYNAKE